MEKQIPIGKHHFKRRFVSFRGCIQGKPMVKLRPLLIKPAISRGEKGYVVGGG